MKASPRLIPLRLSVLGLCVINCLTVNAAENLLRNGSFEGASGGLPLEWESPAGKGVDRAFGLGEGHDSPHSAEVRVVAYERFNRTSRAVLAQRNLGPVEPERWYRLSGWLRASGLRSGLLRATMVDEQAGENAGLYLEIPVGESWARFEKTFKATVKASVRPTLELFVEEAGGFWADDFELIEVPVPGRVFTDMIPQGSSPNLLPNGSFEGSTENWTSLGRQTAWVGGLSSLTGKLDGSKAWEGRYSLRIDLNDVTMAPSYFDVWPAQRVRQDAPLAANIGWLPVRRGEPVTLSAYLCADRPGVPAQLALYFTTPDGPVVRKGERVILTQEWQRYTFCCPAEAEAVFVAVGPDLSDTAIGAATVWLDAVQLEQGKQPTAFAARNPLSVMLTSAEFGNVFSGSTVPRLQLAVDNRGPAQRMNLELRFKDYFGRDLPAQPVKLEIPAQGLFSRDIELKLPGKGYYAVELHDRDQPTPKNILLRPFVMAWIEDYQHADSSFGINHVPSTHELSQQLRRAGLTWGRDWSINWQYLEPTRGALDFTVADVQIDRIGRENLHPLALLPPFPSANWASSIPPEAVTESPEWAKLWIEMAYPPRDLNDLDGFIRKAANHFKSRVQVWEFLNEPFYTLHALPALDQIDESLKGLAGADYKVGDYVDLLKRANRITKEISPNSRMIGGIGGRPDLLSQDFFKAGGLQHLDIFNLHIYPGLRKPEYYIGEMERLLKGMDENGGRKPIWITEYGYYGIEQTPWKPYVLNAWEWAGNRLLKDEREASDFSLRFAIIMLAHGVEKIFYHSGMGVSSTVNSHASNESWMTGYGGVPRKLYPAQAALANFLGERPVFSSVVQLPASAAQGSLCGYTFDTPGRAVAAVWAPDHPVKVKIARGIRVWDVMGNPVQAESLTLGATPYYLTSDTLNGKQLAAKWTRR